MLAHKGSSKIEKLYYVLVIIAFSFGFFFQVTGSTTYASETMGNFYDYVREERDKELSRADEVAAHQLDTLLEKRENALKAGRIASAALFLMWVGMVYLARKKYLTPYNVKKEYETAAADFNMTPLEVSVILHMSEISKYDLVATFFDLITRGFLEVEAAGLEMRVYINEETFAKSADKLENYEEFLIGWLIKKIGNSEYFSNKRLLEYLSANSRAAEFDIDYDVWLDEVNDFITEKSIYDGKSERWRRFIYGTGLLYAILGLLLLYLTGTTATLLLFAITFLSIKMPFYTPIRSRQAEEDYQRLLGLKTKIMAAIATENDIENTKKWDKYFVYSIPMEMTELLFEKYKGYRIFYQEVLENFEKAMIYANIIVKSPNDNYM